MRILLGFLIFVATMKVSAVNVLPIRKPSVVSQEDIRIQALENAGINPNSALELSWEQVDLSSDPGRIYNALLVYCQTQNDCRTLAQAGVFDKQRPTENKRSRKYSILNLGEILARTNVSDITMRLILVNHDDFNNRELASRTLRLSDLINNNAEIHFFNNTKIKIQIN